MWNLGFTCGLALFGQVTTGLILAMRYENACAHIQLEHLERHTGAWSFRRAHSVGTTLYFISLYLHIARSIISTTLPSTATRSGGLIFIISIGVALLGYSLTEGNMARWALTVVASVVLSLPAGAQLYPIIIGDYGISSLIIPRIYSIHFLCGIICLVLVYWHTSSVHSNEGSTDLNVRNCPTGKDFVTGGLVKDAIMISVFCWSILAGYCDQSWLWGIIDDVNANDWPHNSKTPEPIGPEWYVLSMFSGLKLTTIENLIGTIVVIILAIALPRVGYAWQKLIILITSCFIVLGYLALEAHESLEEPKVTAFMLLWTTFLMITGNTYVMRKQLFMINFS